ncbi:ribokinase, partial [Burkholderia pseudomallei]
MTAAVERAAGGASPARAGRVMVVGSLNMDLVVRSARLPRPGETLAGRSFAQAAGVSSWQISTSAAAIAAS